MTLARALSALLALQLLTQMTSTMSTSTPPASVFEPASFDQLDVFFDQFSTPNATFNGTSTFNSTSNGTHPHPPPPPGPHPLPPPPPPPHPHPHPGSGSGGGDATTFSPGMVFEVKLYASEGAEYQHFGRAVAAYGNHVAVGAARESMTSKVYLFNVQVESQGEGEGEEEADASAFHHIDNPASADDPATAASVSTSSTVKQGARMLSRAVNVSWSQDPNLVSTSSGYDGFGLSVAMGQGLMVVGAPYDNAAGYATGLVYAFTTAEVEAEGQGEEEGEEEESEGEGEGEGEEEGEGEVEGDALAQAEAQQQSQSQSEQYDNQELIQASMQITSNRTIAPQSTAANTNMNFGAALSLYNGTLAVGAPGDSAFGTKAGAVYIFGFNETTSEWQEQAVLYATEAAPYAKYGCALALTPDTLAVGATGYSQAGSVQGGAVFLYARASSTAAFADDNSTDTEVEEVAEGWVLQSLLAPSTLASYSQFGHTLAFSGNVGAVSAYTQAGTGVVYLYQRAASASASASSASAYLRTASASVTSTSTSGSWDLVRTLTPTSSSSTAGFGASLSIFHSNDDYLISAVTEAGRRLQDEDEEGEEDGEEEGEGEEEEEEEEAEVQGDGIYVVAVGAPGDGAAAQNAGAVYLFLSPLNVTYAAGPGNESDSSSAYARASASAAATGADSASALATALASALASVSPSAAAYAAAAATTSASSSSTEDPYTEWSLMAKVFANDSTPYNGYGTTLAVLGTHLLIGAEMADTPYASKAGAIYLETNLIPYMVAYSKQVAASEGDDDAAGETGNDDASGEPEGDSSGFWDNFSHFFSSQGGIMTMAFVPVGLLSVFVVMRAKKDKKLLGGASCMGTRYRYLNEDNEGGEVEGGNVGGGKRGVTPPLTDSNPASQSSSTSNSAQHTPEASDLITTDHSATGTVLSETVSPLTTVPLTAEEADAPPSTLQQLGWLLFNPFHPAHRKLPKGEEGDLEVSNPTSSNTAPASGPDFRVGSASASASASVRSPITHIPKQSVLMPSPKTKAPPAYTHAHASGSGIIGGSIGGIRSYRTTPSASGASEVEGEGEGSHGHSRTSSSASAHSTSAASAISASASMHERELLHSHGISVRRLKAQEEQGNQGTEGVQALTGTLDTAPSVSSTSDSPPNSSKNSSPSSVTVRV